MEEIISTLEYSPTPNVAAKKPMPLTRIDCAEDATALLTASRLSDPARRFCK